MIVAKVAKQTMKVLDEMPNTMHVKSFLASKNGFWRRWLTAQMLSEAWPAGTQVFDYHGTTIPMIARAYKVRTRLQTYSTKFNSKTYVSGIPKQILDNKKQELFEAMWWDQSIVNDFKVLVAYSERWKLLRYVNLHTIPAEDLKWVMEQVGLDNPELIYRNNKRKQLITNEEEENS